MRDLKNTDFVKITGRHLRDLKKINAATKRIQGQRCWFCDNPNGIAGPGVEIQLGPGSKRAVPVVSLCEQCRANLNGETDKLISSGAAYKLPVFP